MLWKYNSNIGINDLSDMGLVIVLFNPILGDFAVGSGDFELILIKSFRSIEINTNKLAFHRDH